MITQLILDQKDYKAGTPVEFVDWLPGHSTPQGRTEYVLVKMPDGKEIEIDAAAVSAGIHSPEETLPELERLTLVNQNTLLVAIRNGRLMARRSGATWVSTVNAVEWAIAQGAIRKPS